MSEKDNENFFKEQNQIPIQNNTTSKPQNLEKLKIKVNSAQEQNIEKKSLTSNSTPVMAQGYFKKPKRKMDKGLKVFLAITGTLVGMALMFIMVSEVVSFVSKRTDMFPFGSDKISGVNSQGPTLNIEDHTEAQGTIAAQEIYKQVAPSIVGILTYNPSAGLVSSSAAQGSGIIMSQDGYIITNAHVIGNSNKYKITVVTCDNKEYEGNVVGYDARTDIAVVKINANNLPAANFGNSEQLAVGEWVLAIGNPGGLEFSNSLTRGLVSALNRSVGANSLVKYIQTDAAINPGNSGGALLNMYGQVIGVNSAKITDFEGMGFAIPINTAKTVVDDIISRGYVSGRVKLGITVRQLSAYEAQSNDVPQGLLVAEINSESDAAAKGLCVGDIIVKVNGVNTPANSSLYTELSKFSPGAQVELNVYRQSLRGQSGNYLDIKVNLLEDKG